jgi:TolA-binding protein
VEEVVNDPERLLDAGASPFERYLLDAAANEKPPLELVNGMQAGLGLGANTGAIASAGGFSGVASYVAVAVLGFGAVLAGYVALQSPARSQPVPAKPSPAVIAAPVAPPGEAAPAAEAKAAATPQEAAPVPKKVSTVSKPSSGDELRQELKLIDEARAALKGGAPARARALLEQHARRFPSGSFRQEADVLRVEALERLGERQKAASLAREFLSEHPESPHVERVGKAANSAR